MYLMYDRGDPEHPVGHALLYFTLSGAGPVAATYIVVPPVAIELEKYIPPLIASSLGAGGLVAQTAFLPIPPVPAAVDLEKLRHLAVLRGDDVILGGAASGTDASALMARVADAGDAYARAYQEGLARAQPEKAQAEESGVAALALLYSTLSERERLEELARQAGRLRYAVEGGERPSIDSARAEMQAIATYLPKRYRADELIEVATRPDATGARLAQLYLERGFKLSRDEDEGISSIEAEIAALRGQPTGS